MLLLRIWLLVCSAAFFRSVDCQAASSYVAAVVEFHPLGSNFQQNVQKYVDLIIQATAQGAQIIVFPEYGLTTTIVAGSRPLSLAVGQDLPPLQSNPCDELSNESRVNTEAIRRLSCAARDGGIYVVANLIERQFCQECADDNYLIYNSNVAFDANGTLVARYRKFNRYGESSLNVTSESDIAVFTTSFGATFATFTCMDLLFYDPSVRLVTEFNVTDVAFPTAWFSELPFLTAVQAQSAWAVGMQVNFLGAGYNHPAVGNTGSGIYGATDGAIKALMAQEKGTTLLVASVPLNNKRGRAARAHAAALPESQNAAVFTDLDLKNDNLRDYTSTPLSSVIGSAQRVVHCQANLCCAADYELEAVAEFSGFNYRLVVIDGIVTHDGGNYINREQVCSVIACGGTNTTSCSDDLEWSTYSSSTIFRSLVVSGNFSTNLLQPNTLVVPSLSTLVPKQDFDFETYPLLDDAAVFDSKISLTGVHSNIHSFGIFSHDFEQPAF